MSTRKASNISLTDFRKVLKHCGLNHIRTNGGHEVWCNQSTPRPVIIQTHIDPIPEFIVLNNLDVLGISSKKMWEIIDPPKGTTERKTKVARKGKRSNK